jgi:hypothetical protein
VKAVTVVSKRKVPARRANAKRIAVLRPLEGLIHVIREQRVMLDADLADLYKVATKSLNLAVRRNHDRFPEDFMFQLTKKESSSLRFQFETSKNGRGGRRYLPYAFTEQGVAMLSSVLKSDRAAQMNIAIMRVFVRIRQIISSSKEIAERVEKLEPGHKNAASVIEVLANDIGRIAQEVDKMKALPLAKKSKIGFRQVEAR